MSFKESLLRRQRAETPELEIQERLERGHRVTTLCLQLENYLIDEPKPTWEGFLLTQPDVSFASPERITAMQTLIETTALYTTQLEEMKRLFKIDQQPSSEVAAFIFEKKLGKKPQGAVDMEIQGGYIIFYCQNDGDYISFTGSEHSGGQMHGSMSLNLEIEFDPDTNNGISRVEYIPPVLPIRGSKADSYTPEAVTHERQHFIYDVLYREQIVEKDIGSSTDFARDRLKDEIMAFFRDSGDVSGVNTPELYGWIFERLGDKYKKLVSDLTTEVQKTPQHLLRRARGLIVYQLMLAPVESYPRLYKKLVDFYSKQPELVNSIRVRDTELNTVPPPLSEIPLPELPPDPDDALFSNNL